MWFCPVSYGNKAYVIARTLYSVPMCAFVTVLPLQLLNTLSVLDKGLISAKTLNFLPVL